MSQFMELLVAILMVISSAVSATAVPQNKCSGQIWPTTIVTTKVIVKYGDTNVNGVLTARQPIGLDFERSELTMLKQDDKLFVNTPLSNGLGIEVRIEMTSTEFFEVLEVPNWGADVLNRSNQHTTRDEMFDKITFDSAVGSLNQLIVWKASAPVYIYADPIFVFAPDLRSMPSTVNLPVELHICDQ